MLMDASKVSFHTPATKPLSKRWLEKGLVPSRHIKSTPPRTKQIVLVFFDSHHTNYLPREPIMNANYIVDALNRFLKTFKQRRPAMVAKELCFHWDNVFVHTAAVTNNWMMTRQLQVLQHWPHSPDLAPPNFILFPRTKRELTGLTVPDHEKPGSQCRLSKVHN